MKLEGNISALNDALLFEKQCSKEGYSVIHKKFGEYDKQVTDVTKIEDYPLLPAEETLKRSRYKSGHVRE